jgi:hypothetical protein
VKQIRAGAAPAETVPVERRTVLDERPTAGAHPRLVLIPMPVDGGACGRGAPWAANLSCAARGSVARETAGTGAVDVWSAAGALAAGVAVLMITIELGRRAGAPPGLTAACSVAACSAVAVPRLAAAALSRRSEDGA